MSQRLFVGNLPAGVAVDDLKNEFNAYGNVKNVELKIKDNLVDPDNPNIFAFVTLDITQQMIKQCINEFSQEQYRGRYLTVSVARESFLDRLKREREEASQKGKNVPTDLNVGTQIEIKKDKCLPKIEKEASSSSYESDSDNESSSSEAKQTITSKFAEKKKSFNGFAQAAQSDILENIRKHNEEKEDESIFISKKRASASLQNGKIRIEPIESDPIHVINKKSKNLKELDEKGKISDIKRKQSLNKMKNQYNQQKLAIQKALSSIDTNKMKKIVFDDKNEDNVEDKIVNGSKKISLFDENDDEDDDDVNYKNDFKIKNQYEGKSGEKLMKLQSKFMSDPRFRMDEKFLDDNHVDNNKQIYNEVETKSIDDNDNERHWQLGIIEQVIGRKLNTLSEPYKKKLHKTMLRYDPTKQEDQKFLKSVQKIAENMNEEKDEVNVAESDKRPAPEVSKDRFYKINEDLKKSLKRRGDGFSLLSLFGSTTDTIDDKSKEQMDTTTVNETEIKLLILKSNNHIDNPFTFDSSDSETEDLHISDNKNSKESIKTENKTNKKTNTKSLGGKTTKIGVWNENFFIFENDQRLKDGVEFFKPNKSKDTEKQEDYEKVRDKLRLIIKKKIVKSRKNLKNSKPSKGKFRRKR